MAQTVLGLIDPAEHVLVDTQGMLMEAIVRAADI